MPNDLADIAHGIQAGRLNDSVLAVVFLWGRGFPARNSTFAYRVDGKWPNHSDVRWQAAPLDDNWFSLFDSGSHDSARPQVRRLRASQDPLLPAKISN